MTAAVPAAPPRPPRFHRADWLDLGLVALGEEGPAGLTIEAMCRRAGKTKGSFYAHFATTETFLAGLAERWRATTTDALIKATERHGLASRKLDFLNRLVADLDPRLEQAMRRLATQAPVLAPHIAGVDRTRIDYLASLYATCGRYDPTEARALATVEYAAYLGLQQIAPDTGRAPMKETYKVFLKLTGRG